MSNELTTYETTYPTAIFLNFDIPCVFCAAENVSIRSEELDTFVVILLFCIVPVKTHTVVVKIEVIPHSSKNRCSKVGVIVVNSSSS